MNWDDRGKSKAGDISITLFSTFRNIYDIFIANNFR
jgi:hypothetical protein